MKQKVSWERLTKYFAGELTLEKKLKVESWIKADPDRKEKVEQLERIWKESSIPPYDLDVDQAWNRLEKCMEVIEVSDDSELSDDSSDPTSLNQGVQKRRMELTSKQKVRAGHEAGVTFRRVVMAAASVLIILTAALFSYHFHFQDSETVISEDVTSQVFETRDGERATYRLQDGSKVVLHAGSRLEVSDQFNVTNRELSLEGEAYFEVEHDNQKPFVVNSEHAYTRVIGTSFLVQAWPNPDNEVEVEVVVVEGKVILGDAQPNEAMISANQRGTLAGNSATVVSDVDDLDWYLGWTEGRLVFNDRPLNEIIPRLERWYAVDIQAENDNIANRRITAEIDYGQPMNEVLQGIALSLELEVTKDNGTITFR